jgi:outer membrane protein W
MRIATAAALVAIAGPAHAAPRHTWYYVNILERKCEVSPLTPEQFATAPIPAKNAARDSNGQIIVEVDRQVEGETRVTYFFTDRNGCEIVANGLKTRLAPSGDVN